ncbi:hypothetical protein GGR54DRAFT_653384 [Hypoxylon sp. NC1633]|nr:hypothetical protein GGR54DRAFT_653384 [Hypoxylon sp. NC1633]
MPPQATRNPSGGGDPPDGSQNQSFSSGTMDRINGVGQQRRPQVDEQLSRQADKERLLHKKRRLLAIKSGEPDFYMLPEPAAPAKRHRGSKKLDIEGLTYKGGSYQDLQEFLSQLELQFCINGEEYEQDADKVALAVLSLKEPMASRFNDHLKLYPEGLEGITWKGMKRWLQDGVGGEGARRMIVAQKMVSLHQGPNQTFETFYSRYNQLHGEEPDGYQLPSSYVASRCWGKLTEEYRDEVKKGGGVPTELSDLWQRGVEADMRDDKKDDVVKQEGPNPDHTEKACRKCSEKRHIQANCPTVQCYKCKKHGHYANRCKSDDDGSPIRVQTNSSNIMLVIGVKETDDYVGGWRSWTGYSM